MPKTTIPALITQRDPVVAEIFERLVKEVRTFGPVDVEEKKTCLHLAHGTAFAGIHPRASGIVVNIRHASRMEHARFRKVEQISKNRFMGEVLLEDPKDVDKQLVGWLAEAYAISANK